MSENLICLEICDCRDGKNLEIWPVHLAPIEPNKKGEHSRVLKALASHGITQATRAALTALGFAPDYRPAPAYQAPPSDALSAREYALVMRYQTNLAAQRRKHDPHREKSSGRSLLDTTSPTYTIGPEILPFPEARKTDLRARMSAPPAFEVFLKSRARASQAELL